MLGANIGSLGMQLDIASFFLCNKSIPPSRMKECAIAE